MEVDHIVARAKGGQNNRENLQMCAPHVTGGRATGTQAELVAKLKRDGLR